MVAVNVAISEDFRHVNDWRAVVVRLTAQVFQPR